MVWLSSAARASFSVDDYALTPFINSNRLDDSRIHSGGGFEIPYWRQSSFIRGSLVYRSSPLLVGLPALRNSSFIYLCTGMSPLPQTARRLVVS
jgi:hypothetical protein